MAIRLLEPGVVSKIAAGEVIQRPVNVVKELVENSLDALSTSVTVEIKSGGADYIRVTDNGCGIDAGDAILAFERHATSKITSADELYALETLGFRGEALASVAAISHVTMITRTENAQSGYTVTIHGGSMIERKELGSPEGTSIIVRNLFYNTPVRRQFLKKAAVEAGYVGDLMARMILSNPSVSFRYINNDKVYYHSTGSGDMASAMFCIYGRSLLPMLLGVRYDDGCVGISGYVSNMDVSRSNRAQQSFFINGRYVRSTLLSEAVQQAYGGRLPKGKYPIFVMNILVAPSEVDVNVHPNKLSVQFRDEARVIEALTRAVEDAFKQDEGVPKLFPVMAQGEPRPPERDQANLEPETNSLREYMRPNHATSRTRMAEDFRVMRGAPGFSPAPFPKHEADRVGDSAGDDAGENARIEAHAAGEAQVRLPDGVLSGEQQELEAPVKIIGCAYETYWFVQQGGEIYLVDQHAAHERLNYDRLLESASSGSGAQQLLEPVLLRLTAARGVVLERSMEELERLGFCIEEFGPLTYRVSAVPCAFPVPDVESFLTDALDALESKRETHVTRLETLMLMACKASVKAGDTLSGEEAEWLFAKQNRTGPLTCPHGRPIMLSFTKKELERLFKR